MKHSKLHKAWRDVALRMWRIVLMAFALCLLPPTQSFALTDGWEQCGTCEWRVGNNGDLVVRPVDDGSEGELADWGNGGPPWVSSASSLVSARFEGIVHAKTCFRLFDNCSALNSVDLAGLDTSDVLKFNLMFSGCSNLVDIDLSYLDVSHAISTSNMFNGCSSLNSIDLQNFDTSNVESMSNMFCGCSAITNLDVSSLDTSSVIDMGGMFAQCSSLRNLDLTNFDTKSLESMYKMFSGCTSLSALDLSSFNTSKVGTMCALFFNCRQLTSLDLSSFDTSSLHEMDQMFRRCAKLSHVDISGFKTSSVTTMYALFNGCSSLESVDISHFETSSVKDMRLMFAGCYKIALLDFSNFDMSSVRDMYDMFEDCNHLERWSVPNNWPITNRHAIPSSSSTDKGWWSQRDQKWYTVSEIRNRVGIADTYTNTETSRPHSCPGFTSGTATLSIGSDISLGASGDSPAKIDIDVEWDDAWFAADSSTYNHDLGIASSVLASAVYHDDDYSHGTYAKDDLEALGFDMSTYECYYPHSRNDYKGRIDQVGYCFATKWIDGGDTPLVAVLVRGTTRNVEWVSNFNIAEHTYPSDEHEGFARANESLLTALRMYLAKGIGEEVDLSRVVFLVTGHSRGAAVANLLGHSLDEGAVSGSSGASEKGRVYVYTFASPNVSADYVSTTTGDWGNIFNIVNPDDLVPKVALAKWGYGRYGVTKVLPSKSNMSPKQWNTYYHYVLQPEFSALTKNKTLECYPNGAQASNEFADSFYSIAPDIRTYYNGKDIVQRLVPPSHLLQGVGYLLGDGSATEISDALSTAITYYPEFAGMLSRTVFKEFPTRYDLITPYVNLYGAFSDAHTSETYIASMMALNSASFDFVESYRGLKVACPVDVRVYDEDGTLVCSIVDNVVDEAVMENGLAASVVGGVKRVDIPEDGRYRVEISATDDGTMDVSYQERTAEGVPVGQVSYAEVPLVEGGTYQASLSQGSETGAIQDDVALASGDGVEVGQTRVITGDEVSSISIQVVVGEGSGTATGSSIATWGDPVIAVATPMEGADFLGWYEGGELVSDEASYQFRAEVDRVLEARFSSVTPMADVSVAEVPEQTYTGSAIEPSVSLTHGDYTLEEGKDYTLSYADNVNVGTATVTISGTGAFEGEVAVSFTIAKAAQSVAASGKTIAMGKAVSLGAKASAGGKLTYKSSNTAIAKVSAKGVVTPVKVGTAKVTVTAAETANYRSATKTVTVKVTQGAQKVTASNITVGVKKTAKLGAKSSGDGKLTYKSSNTAVATVSAKGVVTGRKPGTAKVTITAAKTANYKAATKTVTVTVKGVNTLTAKAKKGTVKASLKTLKSKSVTLASNIAVSKAKGSVSYANVSSNATAKRFKVNASTGKVAVPKGTKKGTYTVKVKVTAKGTATYYSGTKTVTFKVNVQ